MIAFLLISWLALLLVSYLGAAFVLEKTHLL